MTKSDIADKLIWRRYGTTFHRAN